MSLLDVQSRNKSNRIKNILIVFLIFFLLWNELGFRLDKHEQQIIAEIERIEIYFRGNLIVSKIPPWVERATMNTDVAKLQHLNYLLQDRERAERMEEDPWALAGMPYYPFVSKEKALKCFHALTEEEKSKYIVVSCSIIYIGHSDDKNKKAVQEAAEYFDNRKHLLEETFENRHQ